MTFHVYIGFSGQPESYNLPNGLLQHLVTRVHFQNFNCARHEALIQCINCLEDSFAGGAQCYNILLYNASYLVPNPGLDPPRLNSTELDFKFSCVGDRLKEGSLDNPSEALQTGLQGLYASLASWPPLGYYLVVYYLCRHTRALIHYGGHRSLRIIG